MLNITKDANTRTETHKANNIKSICFTKNSTEGQLTARDSRKARHTLVPEVRTFNKNVHDHIRPVRRAPPPPKFRPMGPQPRNDDLLVIQTEGEEIPRPVPRASRLSSRRTNQNGLSRSASLPLANSMLKKVPPPRPPPPKFNPSQKGHHQLEHNGSSKSSSIVGGMFGKLRGPPPSRPRHSPAHGTTSAPSTPVCEASLIDFSSPPSSPTTRSGSDGLSVNSFGSESSTGNQSLGFDDIFDPFGSIQDASTFVPPRKVGGSSFFSYAPAACTVSETNENQDPFDMLARRADMNSIQLNKPKNPAVPIQNSPLPSTISSTITQSANQFSSNKQEQKNFRPTIIRPKAPVSSSLVESAGDSNINMNNHYLELGSVDWSVATKGSSTSVVKSSSGWDTGTTIIDQTILEEPPPLPPRPEAEDEDEDRPHGIAEFDFVANHSGDLDFKVGDVIQLLYRINDEWLFGRCGLKEGMFPQAFVKIVVPLAGEQPPAELSSQSTSTSVINTGSSIQSGISNASSGSSQVVTAVYTFQAEAPEDLTIHEGSEVHVIGRLNDQWLYGQCNGKYGQFPGNFVDRIPPNLPQM
ncbi:SH3 domain-containing protein 19 isoform X2 [Procambarus clarkii]